MVVLGRARPWRSVKREHVAFQNSHMFEVAADRSSGCQAADSSAYHNRMLTYGGEYRDDGLASFPSLIVGQRAKSSEAKRAEDTSWSAIHSPRLMLLTETE